MTIVETETIIHRPPEEVFALHSDFRKRLLWHDHVLSSELLTGEPIGLGSQFRTRNKTLWFTIQTYETITAYDSPHHYCYELDSGPLHITSCQTFTAIADGTHYQLLIELQGKNWPGRLVLPLIVKQQQSHFVEAARELKRYMENQP